MIYFSLLVIKGNIIMVPVSNGKIKFNIMT